MSELTRKRVRIWRVFRFVLITGNTTAIRGRSSAEDASLFYTLILYPYPGFLRVALRHGWRLRSRPPKRLCAGRGRVARFARFAGANRPLGAGVATSILRSFTFCPRSSLSVGAKWRRDKIGSSPPCEGSLHTRPARTPPQSRASRRQNNGSQIRVSFRGRPAVGI